MQNSSDQKWCYQDVITIGPIQQE
uniref:Uncharacterized protein n=1 Tax=Meloidogyne hapla TaxID=6305 RepID=A0A1I8BMQ9_MELHA